jgi:peptide/nickel transport system substrate-binding protein
MATLPERRKPIALLALAAFALALGGCSTASAGRDPDTLVVVYGSDANTLNPLYANNEPSFLFYGFVFDSLTNEGLNYSVIPWLASSWTSTPDHLHWEVNLRHGVTWSDGAPFDSRDVLFTYKTMLDPKVAFLYAGSFSYIKKVTAEGPYRVRFDLSNVNVLFPLQGLGTPMLPVHILGKIPAAQQRLSSFGQHPIGTGPYVLSSWHHDDTITFVRNPHWWHGPAKIKRIQIRIVLDNDARVDAMADGSADLYASMAPADYRTLKTIAPHLEYYHVPDLYSRFIFSNDTLPGLSDLQVRRAMMYGWDRDAVANGLYHGDVVVNDALTPWALKTWHDANVMHYAYDPARARAMLDAAGWKLGPDGVRQRGSVRLSFTLKNSTGDSVLNDVCAAFQADMRAIGIAVSVQQLDYATFIDQTNEMHYQLAMTGWGGVSDPDEFTFLDSSQIVPVGNNEVGYRDPAVDHDLRTGLRTFDVPKRRAIYDDFQRRIAANLPVLWGYDEKFGAAWAPRVKIDRAQTLPDLLFWWNVFDWQLAE